MAGCRAVTKPGKDSPLPDVPFVFAQRHSQQRLGGADSAPADLTPRPVEMNPRAAGAGGSRSGAQHPSQRAASVSGSYKLGGEAG